MTDLLLRPEDTGEIPTGPRPDPDQPGEDTRNLAPYVYGLAPAMRRPTAVLALIASFPPPAFDHDDPIGPEEPPGYVGRHRKPEDLPAVVPPGRFGWLRSILSAAVQRIREAW